MSIMGGAATIQVRLDRDPRSARRARRAVLDLLNGDTPPETIENAVLLTSELVTNAVTHTLSEGELVAHYDQLRNRLRIEVCDNSPVLPRIQVVDFDGAAGGFGLRLVEALASNWGTTTTATGKTVWFELTW